MKNWLTVIFPLLGIFIVSCEAPEIIELPEEEPKLVLNLISEDSIGWRAYVSQSKGPLDSPPFPAITNASVRIFESGQLLEQLPFVDNADLDDYYVGQVSYPVPGKTYSIEVTSPSLNPIASEYKQPVAVDVEDFQVALLGTQSSAESYRMKFWVTFTDPAENNYYTVTIRQKTEDSEFPSGARDLILIFSNPAYEENKRVFKSSIALTDRFFQSTQVTLEFESILSSQFGSSLEDLPYFTVTLQNMSEATYEYLKTVYIQDLTWGDPFAQPIIVANNIKNGYGIFGGYTQTKKTTEYK